MRQRMTLAGQFLLLQLCIVLLVVGAVAAVSIAQADAAFRRDEGARLRSVGENAAINRTVRVGLGDPGGGQEALAAAAESARAISGATYVLIADASGQLVTGPDTLIRRRRLAARRPAGGIEVRNIAAFCQTHRLWDDAGTDP